MFKGIKNRLNAMLQIGIEQEIRRIHDEMRARLGDPLICYGFKVYSQCDEDGIIEEIFRRIGDGSRLCVEIGCGNGLENNTHYLLLKGWRGVWIDGSDKNVRSIQKQLGIESHRDLALQASMVAPENVNAIIDTGLRHLNAVGQTVDFLSIDIDGYDLAVLKAMNIRPRVICAEYNAKFPPPLKLSVPYDAAHGWNGNDYMGASLAALCDLLESRGYDLVCCNVSAANAFFVLREENRDRIPVYPINELYQPPRYHLVWRKSGHDASLGYLKDCLHQKKFGQPSL